MISSTSHQLPQPDPESLETSRKLFRLITEEISRCNGAISLERYMELALFAPGMGYYSSGRPHFDAQSDFITAPEIGNLFGRTVARQCIEILKNIPDPIILEIGGGSGSLAATILSELERQHYSLKKYQILEPSPILRARQKSTLDAHAVTLPVQWINHWPDKPWRGIVIANELFDAFPVRAFKTNQHGTNELKVTLEKGNLRWLETKSEAEFEEDIRSVLGDLFVQKHNTYVGELIPNLPAWFASLNDYFDQGLFLIFDYGDARRERYHLSRSQGTLRAFYKHHILDTPFWLPGLCDLTTDVDFTHLTKSACESGMSSVGFVSQGSFLLSGGLEQIFQEAFSNASDVQSQLQISQEVKRLTLPDEMGERFKVCALAKGNTPPPSGFAFNNHVDRLLE